MIGIKKDIVVDGKDKRDDLVCTTSKTTSDFDESNGDSKPRPPKFISFLLSINQDVLSDLQLQF